jgi:N-carbamoyl-L-amino-acid hydrolase
MERESHPAEPAPTPPAAAAGTGPETPDVARAAGDVRALLDEIDGIGHDPRHPEAGYHRSAWTVEDARLRVWFTAQLTRLGLTVEIDRAGNLWGWWLPAGVDAPAGIAPGSAVTTGSHLDSVPGGGRFDGPLGVVSALVAIETLQRRGWTPACPVGVVCFSDEEGARFRLACFGSRVLTGIIAPGAALATADEDGVTLATALADAGVDTAAYGADPAQTGRIGAHIELHVEQGFALSPLGAPLGVASMIWPHGRWHVTLGGEANHAGTTPLERRTDPMLPLADLIKEARAAAEDAGGVATVGKVLVTPNGVNVIPSRVDAWLDVRAPDDGVLDAILARLRRFDPRQESRTPATVFTTSVADALSAAAERVAGQSAPVIPTAAGHDAGILQDAGVPAGMVFVRSTTGASHTPAEDAADTDCGLGALAVAAAVAELAGGAAGTSVTPAPTATEDAA